MQMRALSFLNFLWMCSEADHCTSNLWSLATNQLLRQNEIVNHFAPSPSFFWGTHEARKHFPLKDSSTTQVRPKHQLALQTALLRMFHRGSFGVHTHVSRFTFPIDQSVQMNFWSANYNQDWIEAPLFSIDFLLLLPAWLDHIQLLGNRSWMWSEMLEK